MLRGIPPPPQKHTQRKIVSWETETLEPSVLMNLQLETAQFPKCQLDISRDMEDDSTTEVSAYNLIDNDRVRFEIISAMNLDIIIVPVLINDAKLPEKGNIPGALKKLIDCKSHRLRSVPL